MRLFPEVLANFAVGCDGWDWEDDLWKPQRIPRALRPIYDHERGRIRMACPASVRLRFVSDTRRLRIAAALGEPARPKFQGALLVDGKPHAFGPTEQAAAIDQVIFEELVPTKRTFDLWLPHLCMAAVSEVELDDACTVEPAEQLPRRWLAYGDSITQGMTSTLPTTCGVGRAALALEAEVLNLGIGGAMLDRRLAEFVPPGRFDLVSIAYGTNDFLNGIPLGEFGDNAARLIETVAAVHREAAIVLISPPPWVDRVEPNPIGLKLEDYREVVRNAAKGNPRTIYVHGPDLVPEEAGWFVDGVHPTDEGFALYAEKLLARLPEMA